MQNLYVKSENRNFSDEDMYEYLNALPIRIAIDECNPMIYFSNGADSKSSHTLFKRAVTDLFYLKKLDPHLRSQYLWTHYPNNEDVYSKVFFDICQDSTFLNDSLDTYGMNCSLYNSMVNKVCQNGQSEVDNFEQFNVNCSSK